jgi:hydantoinase/carbamoylase family amidase
MSTAVLIPCFFRVFEMPLCGIMEVSMICSKRVQKRLEEIYECGKQTDGTHSRIAFTKEDQEGRRIFKGYLEQLGLPSHVDPAGNLIARYSGKNDNLPAILIGSHMDTVPNGGKYDGVLGCIGALEVVEALLEAGEHLEHSLEIIVFADEEGIRFGKGLQGSSAISGAVLDNFSSDDLDAEGTRREDILREYGIEFNHMKQAVKKRESIHCFLEMHIEQGGSLEKHDKTIGIVTAIAGVKRYEITVTGETNHSGSTRMEDRKDALVTAASFISAVPEIVKKYGSEYGVGTVGKVQIQPNAVNVIPGVCTFSLEIREQIKEQLDTLEQMLFQHIDTVCQQNKVTYKVVPIAAYAPAPMNLQIQKTIQRICDRENISYDSMPSGAFHDAMFMTGAFKSGMLFIPSKDGISHSPDEYSSLEDIQTGCELLLETVKVLDKEIIN